MIGYLSTLMGIGGGILNNTFMTLFGARADATQAAPPRQGWGADRHSGPTLRLHLGRGWGNPLLPIASTGIRQTGSRGRADHTDQRLVVAPYGVRIRALDAEAHLEIAFGIFCLVISARLLSSSLL